MSTKFHIYAKGRLISLETEKELEAVALAVGLLAVSAELGDNAFATRTFYTMADGEVVELAKIYE